MIPDLDENILSKQNLFDLYFDSDKLSINDSVESNFLDFNNSLFFDPLKLPNIGTQPTSSLLQNNKINSLFLNNENKGNNQREEKEEKKEEKEKKKNKKEKKKEENEEKIEIKEEKNEIEEEKEKKNKKKEEMNSTTFMNEVEKKRKKINDEISDIEAKLQRKNKEYKNLTANIKDVEEQIKVTDDAIFNLSEKFPCDKEVNGIKQRFDAYFDRDSQNPKIFSLNLINEEKNEKESYDVKKLTSCGRNITNKRKFMCIYLDNQNEIEFNLIFNETIADYFEKKYFYVINVINSNE